MARQALRILPVALLISTLSAQSPLATGSLNTPRYAHTATLLNNGLVLVTGGIIAQSADSEAATNTAELYDPQTGTWRYTAFAMNSARDGHTATKLADGRVLIAGGSIGAQANSGVGGSTGLVTPTAEIFDPVGETFTSTGQMLTARVSHAAVLLNDGRVLVVGAPPGTQPEAEVFDPVTQTWAAAPVGYHGPNVTAVKLADGRVLAISGSSTNAVDLFDPSSNSWRSMTPLIYSRSQNFASLLPDGTVLVAGGNDGGMVTYTAEIYDVNANSGIGGSTLVSGNVTVGAYASSGVTLLNGDVLLAGGQVPPPQSNNSSSTANSELYSFQSKSFSPQPALLVPRAAFPMALLAIGQVLICGGVNYDSSGTVPTFLSACELRGTAATGAINVTTNLAAATFTITGPAIYNGSGSSFSQVNAPAGEYTISYGAIPCSGTPASQTLTLTAGGSIRFGGTYLGAATISVNVVPAGATSATFAVSPAIPGMRNSGTYPITQTTVVPQPYTVTFNPVMGFTAPPPQTLVPNTSCRLSFSGVYAPNVPPGTAILLIDINTRQGGFTIASTNNPIVQPITVQGIQTYVAQVPAGSYQIHFSSATGYYTPAPQTLVLTPNDSVAVSGFYQRLLVIAFTGFNSAPHPSNCLPLLGGNHNPLFSVGSGVNYMTPQPDAGMTEIVPEVEGLVPGILGVPALQPGIAGAAFTFYGSAESGITFEGDACHSPDGLPDHLDAENWLVAQHPTAYDKIAIIGHSYGGNRARLFVEQLKRNQSIIADLLITVDAIDWNRCNILNVVTAADPFSAAAESCDQTTFTSRDIPSSSARSSFSSYQTMGAYGFAFIMGYVVPGATSQHVVTADHFGIDKDAGVHQTIKQQLLNLVRDPAVLATAGAAARIGGQIIVPVTLSVTGTSAAMSVGITSASLNGLPASNLSSLSNLGDLSPGSSAPVSLMFPGTAAQSGQTVMLIISGQHTSGQTFTLSKRIMVP